MSMNTVPERLAALRLRPGRGPCGGRIRHLHGLLVKPQRELVGVLDASIG